MKRIFLSALTCLLVMPSVGQAGVGDPENYFVGSNIIDEFRCKRMKKHQTGLQSCHESFDATATSSTYPERATYYLVKSEQNESSPKKNHVEIKGYYHKRVFIKKDMPYQDLASVVVPKIISAHGREYLIGNVQFTYSVKEAATDSIHTYTYYSVQRR